jgi:hypothetical protein
MKSPVKWAVAASVLVLAVALIGLQRRWWGLEPATGGRTVTEWLDRMALFEAERRRDVTGQSSFQTIRDPAVVTNDPALVAIVGLGPRAVPVLKERIVEPPRLPFRARMLGWFHWRWMQFRTLNRNLPPPSPPSFHGSVVEARKQAAALALLALGRDQGGGMQQLLETIAAEGTNRLHPYYVNLVFHPTFSLGTAVPGLPYRRAEMAEEVFDLLSHTNALVRRLAAESAWHFEHELKGWKTALIRLAKEGPDTMARIGALWSLVIKLREDQEVLDLCVRTATDTNQPPLLRSYAVSGVPFAGGAAAVQHLPLLETIHAEAARMADVAPGQAGQDYRHLRDSARDAIENINRQPSR